MGFLWLLSLWLSVAHGEPKSPPWLVSVSSNGKQPFACSGALVRGNWVVTAASCRVEVGDTVSVSGAQWITIEKVIRHQNYISDSFSHNIALLQLASQADVVPAQISRSLGASLLAGWSENTLRSTSASVLAMSSCTQIFGNELDKSNLCVEDNLCADILGAVAFGVDGVVGVSSLDLGCGGAPAVYSNLAYFSEWIAQTTAAGCSQFTTCGSCSSSSTPCYWCPSSSSCLSEAQWLADEACPYFVFSHNECANSPRRLQVEEDNVTSVESDENSTLTESDEDVTVTTNTTTIVLENTTTSVVSTEEGSTESVTTAVTNTSTSTSVVSVDDSSVEQPQENTTIVETTITDSVEEAGSIEGVDIVTTTTTDTTVNTTTVNTTTFAVESDESNSMEDVVDRSIVDIPAAATVNTTTLIVEPAESDSVEEVTVDIPAATTTANTTIVNTTTVNTTVDATTLIVESAESDSVEEATDRSIVDIPVTTVNTTNITTVDTSTNATTVDTTTNTTTVDAATVNTTTNTTNGDIGVTTTTVNTTTVNTTTLIVESAESDSVEDVTDRSIVDTPVTTVNTTNTTTDTPTIVAVTANNTTVDTTTVNTTTVNTTTLIVESEESDSVEDVTDRSIVDIPVTTNTSDTSVNTTTVDTTTLIVESEESDSVENVTDSSIVDIPVTTTTVNTTTVSTTTLIVESAESDSVEDVTDRSLVDIPAASVTTNTSDTTSVNTTTVDTTTLIVESEESDSVENVTDSSIVDIPVTTFNTTTADTTVNTTTVNTTTLIVESEESDSVENVTDRSIVDIPVTTFNTTTADTTVNTTVNTTTLIVESAESDSVENITDRSIVDIPVTTTTTANSTTVNTTTVDTTTLIVESAESDSVENITDRSIVDIPVTTTTTVNSTTVNTTTVNTTTLIVESAESDSVESDSVEVTTIETSQNTSTRSIEDIPASTTTTNTTTVNTTTLTVESGEFDSVEDNVGSEELSAAPTFAPTFAPTSFLTQAPTSSLIASTDSAESVESEEGSDRSIATQTTTVTTNLTTNVTTSNGTTSVLSSNTSTTVISTIVDGSEEVVSQESAESSDELVVVDRSITTTFQPTNAPTPFIPPTPQPTPQVVTIVDSVESVEAASSEEVEPATFAPTMAADVPTPVFDSVEAVSAESQESVEAAINTSLPVDNRGVGVCDQHTTCSACAGAPYMDAQSKRASCVWCGSSNTCITAALWDSKVACNAVSFGARSCPGYVEPDRCAASSGCSECITASHFQADGSFAQCVWCGSSCVAQSKADAAQCPSPQKTCQAEVASVKTCRELKWTVAPGSKSCSSGKIGGLCGNPQTFQQAQAWCAAAGARLCSSSELANVNIVATGCSLERERVWTGTACNGGHTSQSGAKYYEGTEPARCDRDTEMLKPLCCADDPSAAKIPAPMATKTCKQLGWQVTPGSPKVCSQSTFANGLCLRSVDFRFAQGQCFSVGARLCTVAELANNEAKGSGCKLDRENSWTSTPCPGGVMVAKGSFSSAAAKCTDLSQNAAVRCCADGGEVDQVSCEDLGWPIRDGVCTTAKVSGKCPGAVDFVDAFNICFEIGTRICTAEQLENGVGSQSKNSCNLGSSRVWSSTKCPGGYVTLGGDGSKINARQCSSAISSFPVRCCASSRAPAVGARRG